jgi:uncharacterized metal-binding protein
MMTFAQNINNQIRSRVEEIIAFSKEAGYQKIGIAHCISVTREARRLEEILSQDFVVTRVGCKVGLIPKTELIGSGYGSSCNPILQAEVLNEQKTDLNIVMALCLGHDLLFNKYSLAPATTLIVKDGRFSNCPSKGLL